MTTLFYLLIALIALMTLTAMAIIYFASQRRFSVMMLVLPMMALSGYFYWGNSVEMERYYALQRQVQHTLKHMNSPNEVIVKLQAQLKHKPQSVEGWFLLGRVYFSLRRFDEASAAFAKAYALQPEQTDIIMQYASSLFYKDQMQLKPATMGLVKKTLSLRPEDAAALNLLALNAYEHGDYKQAVNYWQRALLQYGAANTDRKLIEGAISKAQEKIQTTTM